jgi:hypothetical protein
MEFPLSELLDAGRPVRATVFSAATHRMLKDLYVNDVTGSPFID